MLVLIMGLIWISSRPILGPIKLGPSLSVGVLEPHLEAEAQLGVWEQRLQKEGECGSLWGMACIAGLLLCDPLGRNLFLAGPVPGVGPVGRSHGGQVEIHTWPRLRSIIHARSRLKSMQDPV